MTWAIVALALMNIATIVTVALNRRKSEITTVSVSQITAQRSNASARFSGRWFRDELGLSSSQMSEFMKFNPRFRQNAMRINTGLADLRSRMLNELADAASDTVKLYMLSDSIGSLHAELKKLTCRYYMDFKSICDDQQKEKLEELFGVMFATDERSGQNMGRGPGRMRYGRNQNN